jgi:serine/threonine protein kinase
LVFPKISRPNKCKLLVELLTTLVRKHFYFSLPFFWFSHPVEKEKEKNSHSPSLLQTAPEVLLGGTYDMGVDIWSIGVITYVL